MIHSFNPGSLLIFCHQSRMHLCEAEGARMLNAEDFYADMLIASRSYFLALIPILSYRSGSRSESRLMTAVEFNVSTLLNRSFLKCQAPSD